MAKKVVLLSFLILGVSQNLGKASDPFAGLTNSDQKEEFLRKSCSRIKENHFKLNLPPEQAGSLAADFVKIFKIAGVETGTEAEALKNPFQFIFWNQSQENLKYVFNPVFESLTEIFGDGSPYLQDMFLEAQYSISLAPDQIVFVRFKEELLHYRKLKAIHVEAWGPSTLPPYKESFLWETNIQNGAPFSSLFLGKYDGLKKQVSLSLSMDNHLTVS